ncbi:hypothetical protein [Nocardioides sp. LML1-1-1.1]|uniref:hypothetical protein n=1 Tax=Nocardioides sp. LML1-1-1.1 TaxID=3135248 RepID=UPI003417688F
MTSETTPWIVRADGTIAVRATGEDIGHVYRTDYGWDARLDAGQRSYMHATRAQALESIWLLLPADLPVPTTGEEERDA